MFKIAAKMIFDGKAAKAALADIEKRVEVSTAIALTTTAKAAEAAVRREMATVFDRPTEFTLNSLWVKPATRGRLVAELKIKDESFKSAAPIKWLSPQVHGGARPVKRFEERLRRAGVLGPNEYAVPASAARLDSHGNMSPGQLQAILADMQAHWDHSRDSTVESRRKRSRRRNVSKRSIYFAPRPGSSLPRGVYERTSFGFGSSIRPVLIFVRGAPRYSKRLKFFEVAQHIVDTRYAAIWDRAMAEGIRIAEAKAKSLRIAA